MAARIWAVVQHSDEDGPGMVADELDGAGCEWEVVRVDRGEPLPAAAGLGGLIVLGGGMCVRDGDAHPWLDDERHLLADAVGAGLPVLGVCLGAQQLAAALGAEVTRCPEPEVGVRAVHLTGPGRLDPVFGPEYGGLADPDLPVVQWHGDTFALPPGAVHLAAAPACPNQAFRVGDRVYGLQFHAEVDRAVADVWERAVPAPVTFTGDPRFTEATVVGRRLLRRFVAVGTGRTGPRS
jgi:GMP synthase-like glutamine amidotransferase